MPEWFATENIALALSIAANVGLWKQWAGDRKDHREREIGLLQEANDRDRSYMARLDENAALSRQLIRGQIALGKRMQAVEKALPVRESP